MEADSSRQNKQPRPIFPGIFRPSFASCSSRALSDVVVDKSLILHINNRNSFGHRFPSMCRPDNNTTPLEPVTGRRPVPIPKAAEDSDPAILTLGDVLKGRSCPSAPLVSPMNHPFHKLENKKKLNKSEPALKDRYCFSTDDEREDDEIDDDEIDTLFSSKSFSSDSSGSHRLPPSNNRRKSSTTRLGAGVLPMGGDNDASGIKGSFAVVKKSNDPYGDFKRSMVEMIVEKQIFGAAELERLLQCFLELNSHHHHSVIVQVFTEIWEALFPHWS